MKSTRALALAVGPLLIGLVLTGAGYARLPVVQSTVQTDPCRSGDNCDDTAIWIHSKDPSKSVIIGDDKEGGIAVWDLNGNQIQFIDSSKRMNNLDLRYNFPLTGTYGTGHAHTTVALLAVANESDGAVTVYKVNPFSSPPGKLEHANGSLKASTLSLAKFSPYGGCMYLSVATGKYFFFAIWKDGAVKQMELTGGLRVSGHIVRTFDAGGQIEGCVADDIHQKLYVGEENVGIWAYGAEPSAGTSRTEVDRVGSATGLIAHVEGLSLYYKSDGTGYLIASGQGSGPNARFVVYTRERNNAHVGTFQVQDGDATDGTEVTNFPLGPAFPSGVFVSHDAAPEPSHHRLTPFERIASALGLTMDRSWDPRQAGSSDSPEIAALFSWSEPGVEAARFGPLSPGTHAAAAGTTARERSSSAALILSSARLGLDPDSHQDRLSLRGSLVVPPDGIKPSTEGVTLGLTDGDGQIVEIKIPKGEGWMKTRPGLKWSFTDRKRRSLGDAVARETLSIKFNADTGQLDLRVEVKKAELRDPDAGPITTLLTIGDQEFRNTQDWRSKERGKKLVTP